MSHHKAATDLFKVVGKFLWDNKIDLILGSLEYLKQDTNDKLQPHKIYNSEFDYKDLEQILNHMDEPSDDFATKTAKTILADMMSEDEILKIISFKGVPTRSAEFRLINLLVPSENFPHTSNSLDIETNCKHILHLIEGRKRCVLHCLKNMQGSTHYRGKNFNNKKLIVLLYHYRLILN